MSLLTENTKRWQRARYKPSFEAAAEKFAKRALAHKEEYQAVSETIWNLYQKRIPWWFIPLVHERECVRGVDNWTCNIGQGSPFNVKSNIKPYNGPFHSWREAAVAALVHEHPYAANNTDWSGGGTMTIAEKYNGVGYANMGRPSPYIWSGSDQYVSGKYIADGKYSASTVDTQLGVAVSLRAMMKLDPSIVLGQDMDIGFDKKAETTVAVSTGGGILASINAMSPYYTLTWWDVSGILLGAVVVTGVIIYYVNKYKKRL